MTTVVPNQFAHFRATDALVPSSVNRLSSTLLAHLNRSLALRSVQENLEECHGQIWDLY